jgi:hypothetical protein
MLLAVCEEHCTVTKMIICTHLRSLLAAEKAQYQNSGLRETLSLSHLIIKWLWVILREVFKRSGLCAARQTRLLTTESCCCVRVSLTFVWGAALATAKNKYNDATLMSGTEIGATGNEKGKLSFYLCLVCLGSLLLCE